MGPNSTANASAANVTIGAGSSCPPSLKIHKDSHVIKKPSTSTSPPPPSSSSSSASSQGGVRPQVQPQHRHPVIIYTHSPKIIHTHPRDFMALVQKLTGLSRSSSSASDERPKQNPSPPPAAAEEDSRTGKAASSATDGDESSSVVTEENGIVGGGGELQVNSCVLPPLFDPAPTGNYIPAIPYFAPNSTDFLCSTQPPYYGCTDSFLRTSVSSSSVLEGVNEFRDF